MNIHFFSININSRFSLHFSTDVLKWPDPRAKPGAPSRARKKGYVPTSHMMGHVKGTAELLIAKVGRM